MNPQLRNAIRKLPCPVKKQAIEQLNTAARKIRADLTRIPGINTSAAVREYDREIQKVRRELSC